MKSLSYLLLATAIATTTFAADGSHAISETFEQQYKCYVRTPVLDAMGRPTGVEIDTEYPPRMEWPPREEKISLSAVDVSKFAPIIRFDKSGLQIAAADVSKFDEVASKIIEEFKKKCDAITLLTDVPAAPIADSGTGSAGNSSASATPAAAAAEASAQPTTDTQ